VNSTGTNRTILPDNFTSTGLSKIVILVAILAFLSAISNSLTQITVPLLALQLGASYEFIGTMVAISAFIRLILVQPVGWLNDKKGKKWFLVLGFICFLFNFVILYFATTPLHVLISRAFHGIGGAMFYTSAVSLILTNTKENRGYAIGIYATLMGFGFSVGPIIGGYVAENISYIACYIISSAISILAIIIIVFGIHENKVTSEKNNSTIVAEKTSYFSLFRNRELLITCIGAFFISEAIGADISFFPIFGNKLSLTEGTIGLILGIRATLSTIVRIPVGKIADKTNPKKLMIIALAISAAGLYLIPQFRIVWLFPVFLGLEGIGHGIYLTAANSYIGDVTSDKNKGTAVGLYNTVSGLGSVLNMSLLGIIAGRFGVEYTFRFTSFMCILGLVIMFILSKTSDTDQYNS